MARHQVPDNVVDLATEKKKRRARGGRHVAPKVTEQQPEATPRRHRHMEIPADDRVPELHDAEAVHEAPRRRRAAQAEAAPQVSEGRSRRQVKVEPVGAEAMVPQPAGSLLMKVGMVIMALIIVALVAGVFFMSDMFRIKTISLEGDYYLSDEELLTLSGIREGENLIMLDTERVRERIEADPMLKLESIERKFPDTIVVNVHERMPLGMIAFMGSYALLDEECQVLRIDDSQPDYPCPVVYGIRLTSVRVGETLGVENAKQKDAMVNVLNGLKEGGAMALIESVDFEDLLDITLESHAGVTIEVGDDANMTTKAKTMAEMLPVLESSENTEGRLIVTGGKGATYIPGGEDDIDRLTNGINPNGPPEAQEEDEP